MEIGDRVKIISKDTFANKEGRIRNIDGYVWVEFDEAVSVYHHSKLYWFHLHEIQKINRFQVEIQEFE